MQKKFIKRSLSTGDTVILYASWFQFASGERVLNQRVLSRMLLWCQEGRGRVRVNGTWYTMEPDDFLFLPWQHEVLYLADVDQPFWVAGIHFIPEHPRDRKLVFWVSHHISDEWARCPWRRDIAWRGLEGVRRGVARSSEPLRLLGTYIVERFDEGALPESTLRKLAQLLIDEIALAVTRRAAARTSNEAVRRAQELVESHLNRQMSLHDLARLTQCSVSTLRRQFHEALGMPPYEWILQVRMRRARRLLATTTLRIKEVAAQIGFDDPFQFSRMFRQRIGRSPRQFRGDHAFAPRRIGR
jgi:AraC-like DNA-binding protein